MIKQAIQKVVCHVDLTSAEMTVAFGEIMSGRATPAEIGAFLIGLRMKGETVGEITAAAKVMRARSLKVGLDRETVLDTCGTGGTGTNTFNISTTVAFVIAACGVTIAKHGNRASSSRCGSADVLEALGVKLDISVRRAEECIRRLGIGFLFAPIYHGAMKYAAGPRREIGVRTIFNLLGPLANPAGATAQVLGVYSPELTVTIASVLRDLGSRRAFVVHGENALDEFTVTGRTKVSELKAGRIRTYFVTPSLFGLRTARASDISGGGAEKNARIVRAVLNGERSPRRDIVLMNASAALVVAGRARSFKAGVKIAAEAIDSGRAMEKLEQLIELTNKI